MKFGVVCGRLRHAARVTVVLLTFFVAGNWFKSTGANLTLAWNASSDPMVTGYNVYYGASSGAYTNLVSAGNVTSVTISNLVAGSPYYFAATTINLIGLESSPSPEVSYVPAVGPLNVPPTLDPIADVILNENAGTQSVSLSGISSGSTNEQQTLTVTAFSSNPQLVPNPTVNYLSPNPTGSLQFTPAPNAYGSAVITVMVDDGGAISNTVIRSFDVTINQPVAAPRLMTNAVIAPNTTFRFVLNPPYPNSDRFSYGLDSSAPTGVRIVNRRNVTTLVWSPTAAYASSTNLITIHVVDNTTPALNTNEVLQVVVLDYLTAGAAKTAVQAGQTASLPIVVACSIDGLTNCSLTLDWPTNRFTNPALVVTSPATVAATVQPQGTNLLVRIRALPGQVISGSNIIGQLTFQTLAGQSSAFVNLQGRYLSGIKPTGLAYVDCDPQLGRVVVVNDLPLLESTVNGPSRTLQLYGKVGTSYELQSTTNSLAPALWSPVVSYTQTNVAQALNLDPSIPLIFYRLKQ